MAKTKNPPKKAHQGEYTDKELYEGYYWLILHLDPYNFSWGFINEMGVENIHPVPACVKHARELFGEKVEPNDIENEGLTPDHPLYSQPSLYVDPNKIFTWLLEGSIPRLHVKNRESDSLVEIKGQETVKILWEHLKIPDPVYHGQPDPSNRETVWYPYEYDDKHFQRIERYLELEHKKNLKELETPGAWGKGKEFFKKDWRWLITTIIEIVIKRL